MDRGRRGEGGKVERTWEDKRGREKKREKEEGKMGEGPSVF